MCFPVRFTNFLTTPVTGNSLNTPQARCDKKFNLSKGGSIITSRIGDGWVSAFFVMLRDGKLVG